MKKRWIVLFALVLVLLSATAFAKSYKLISDASVYEDNDSSSDKIGVVSKGDTVDVISMGSSWAKIEMGVAGHPYGYIKTKHLKSSSNSTTRYYVKESSVKVYSRASSSSNVEARMDKGDSVNVYQIEDGWAQIVWGSDRAYIKSKYLSRTKPGKSSGGSGNKQTTPASTYNTATAFKNMSAVSYQAYVTPSTASSYVNLRWGPSKETPVAGVRYNGDTLTVLAQDSTWCQVLDTDTMQVGWMMRKYLTPMVE